MQSFTHSEDSWIRSAEGWRRFLGCCFAVIFGVRAFCIERFGASIAWVDEWEATGQRILVPWSNGTLSWSALFSAHNGDHRIVATRLWEMLWFSVNGAWDPQLVLTAKAQIFASAATIFIHLLAGDLSRRRCLAASVLALGFAFPFNSQNLLWAFQSQFDFFLLAVAVGWLALLRDRIALALGVAVIALFTLGAGPILGVSYLVYFAGAWLRREWSGRKCAGWSVASLGVVVVGLSLRGSEAAPLGSLSEQGEAFLMLGAWPYSNIVALGSNWPESEHLIPASVRDLAAVMPFDFETVALWLHRRPAVISLINGLLTVSLLLPLAALLTLGWRRSGKLSACGPLAIGAFACLMLIATALARSGEKTVAVRYIDAVSLAGFAAFAATFHVLQIRPRWGPFILGWVLLWGPAYAITLAGTVARLNEQRPKRWVEAVRPYVMGEQRTLPQNTAWQLPILERDPATFMRRLDDLRVAGVLPLSLVAPDQPQPLAARIAAWVRSAGLWIAGVGVGSGFWWSRRARGRGHAVRLTAAAKNRAPGSVSRPAPCYVRGQECGPPSRVEH